MRNVYFILTISFISFFSPFLSKAENAYHGARSAALGNASVSLSDVWSVNNNQAGLGYLKKFSAGVYYENRFLLKELNLKSAVIALPTKDGTFALSINSFGFSLYSQNKYALAYGKTFGEKFSAGMQMDCFTTKFAEGYGKLNEFAVEMGIQAKPINKLIIGMHIFNPRLSKAPEDGIPTQMRLGFNYLFSEKVFLAIETEKGFNSALEFKAGIEYFPIKDIYLRAGVSTNPSLNAFGLGLNLNQLKIDLSTSFHAVLGFSSCIGLIYAVK